MDWFSSIDWRHRDHSFRSIVGDLAPIGSNQTSFEKLRHLGYSSFQRESRFRAPCIVFNEYIFGIFNSLKTMRSSLRYTQTRRDHQKPKLCWKNSLHNKDNPEPCVPSPYHAPVEIRIHNSGKYSRIAIDIFRALDLLYLDSVEGIEITSFAIGTSALNRQ